METLDVLIVGGGPGGTSAAFRARENGLKALVIDFDDLMKRIRDYPKDKLILPDFGGGDKMQFPSGGDCVNSLHFAPIDKDDMCQTWKGYYEQHDIPRMIGVELTGLERKGDVYDVKAWNHTERCEAGFKARHVVLCIGKGVPRRFDIPGNTDGVAYRLDDAARYVGDSACVIGGGTSAAEAVIAISNAKAADGDPTPIYWSYRGDKLPRVSKALAEVFFEAYVGNGNVRYHPRSDPAAVVVAEDRKEYLSLRVDRHRMEGRPAETLHLEFRKEQCIACIGEDIPEALLNSVGVEMVTGGPKNKKRMVVNKYLETQQPNLYLVGDILSQAYLETDDFGADPAGFQEVKHRGNVKSALCDGVKVANVIQQRLAGKSDIVVELEYADGPAASPGSRKTIVGPAKPVQMDAPPPIADQPDRQEIPSEAFLIRVLPGGGAEDEYPITRDAVTTIGRVNCDLSFENDTLMSDSHASISHSEDGYFLRDDGSANGVFLRLPAARKTPLEPGDLVRAGRQFLLISGEGGAFFATHYDGKGREVGKHPLPAKTIVLGRQAPDVTLDIDDAVLSRRHLALAVDDGTVHVKDLASGNGTYVRVRSASKLQHGDQFRLGQQLFTFSVQADAVVDIDPEVTHPPVDLPPASRPPIAASAAPASTPGPAPAAAPAAAAPSTAAAPAPPAASTPAPPAASTAPPPMTAPTASPAPAPPTPAATPSPAAESAPAAGGGPSVTFKNSGQTFPVKEGQTLCEIAEENGVEISAECHAGVCGSDPIRILSGTENLVGGPGDQEEETLEDICDLEPGKHRLACMCKVTGPVVVEILSND